MGKSLPLPLPFATVMEASHYTTFAYFRLTWFFPAVLNCLQCFDTVGLASGRESGLQKLSDEVLAWLSVWIDVQMICIWYSRCHCHHIVSCFIKIQNSFTSLLSAYPGCPAK